VKERTRNKLKDYVVLAPTLHVTHLLAFTLTDVAPSLRIVRLPGGPTLSFRIERYSLVKDVLSSVRRAKSIGLEYLSPPLVSICCAGCLQEVSNNCQKLVLAAFPPPGPNSPPHLSLVMKTFQSLFPPLSPGTISLSSARRIVLISYNPEKGTIDFRHYLISVKPYGVSRGVRKVLQGVTSSSKKSSPGFLDLGNEKDVADFLLRKKGEPDPGGGYESATSDASSAAEDEGGAVSLASDYVGRNNKKGQKKAVKLDEIGPRMELRLIKITEGLPGKEGGVIYHDIGLCLLRLFVCTLTPGQSPVKKTKKEISTLKTAAVERERLKKQRREEQERNVEKKEALAAQKKGKDKQADGDEEDEDKEEAGADSDWDDEEEISEGEEEGDEEDEVLESEAESEPEPQRPTKKARVRGHR